MSDLERKFKGIWIPANVWLSEDLNIQQKAILGEIDSYKIYFASNQHLAEKMGLSVPRVKALLGDLRSKGWIKQKETRKGQLTVKRTIWIDQVKFHGIENDTNSTDGIENDTKFVLDPIRGGIGSNTHTNKDTNKVENKDIKSPAVKKSKFCPVHFASSASSAYQGFELNLESWAEWCEFRKVDKKKAITESTAKKQLKILIEHTYDEQKEIIDKSINGSYQGLFALDKKTQTRYAQKPVGDNNDLSWMNSEVLHNDIDQ